MHRFHGPRLLRHFKRFVDRFDRVHQRFALGDSHRIGFLFQYQIQCPATVRIENVLHASDSNDLCFVRDLSACNLETSVKGD